MQAEAEYIHSFNISEQAMLQSYIINSETLWQRFKGDRQVVSEILECFRDSIPVFIEDLRVHIAASDQDATLATVQKILRMAICNSAVTVQECAFQMQHAAVREDMASVREIMPLLEQFCVEVIEAVNADDSLFSNLVDMA